MEKPSKIIHILPHSPASSAYEAKAEDKAPKWKTSYSDDSKNYEKIDYFPYWIGYYQNDWHVQVAREIMERTDTYVHECWRPYYGLKKMYSKNVNGIIHRVFPSRKIKLGRIDFGEYSKSLAENLDEDLQNNNSIVHFHSVSSPFAVNLLNSIDFRRYPLVGQHHGSKINWDIFTKIRGHKRKKKILEMFDNIFVLSDQSLNQICRYLNSSKVTIQTMGIDFSDFRLSSKFESRRMVSLPIDKKVVLFVGRFSNIKGLKEIFSAIPEIENSHPDVIFVFVGAPSERLSSLGYRLKSNIIVVDKVPRTELPKYYNAADIFLLPSYSEGCPLSLLEALCCNLYSISTDVGGIPNIKKKIEELELIKSRDPFALSDSVNNFFSNPRVVKTRSKVIENYSWEPIIENTIEKYKILNEIYYN